ncbi:DUF2271 domain-containing protein [Stutzerimonas urumqiensis]|uniref:DUF2271 domain-containing protein n=1 Tax=Stutzerimonas urumqiensis TaxID=638269 RepID=UPI003BAAE37A
MRKGLALSLLLAAPVSAAELTASVEIPRLRVAEYHRPYVAIWIEGADQRHVANLAVWYDVTLKDAEGEKWLKDLRQWWRRSGRKLDMPVDGVSGATRAVGTHTLTFDDAHQPLASLEPGSYQLVVEAAREVGGRELVKLPFSWPVEAAHTEHAKGETELGAIALTLTP